jgi:hypothetical protein
MAEPFSIAGSAVGVISLGITVCQGLFQYYSACRDGPEDVKALAHSLDGLIRVLEMLSSTMKDYSFDGNAHAAIKDYIADCDEAVRNLARELEKVRKEAPQPAAGGRLSLKDKLGNASKTLLYPFRESTLRKLRGFVEEVCENLALATSSVQL